MLLAAATAVAHLEDERLDTCTVVESVPGGTYLCFHHLDEAEHLRTFFPPSEVRCTTPARGADPTNRKIAERKKRVGRPNAIIIIVRPTGKKS